MIEIRPLSHSFGVEVVGLDPQVPLDAATCAQLREAFDERSLLVFRDLDLEFPAQVYLSKMLIGKEHDGEAPKSDTWYISNEREDAAAPFGRLQFHADAMWADQSFEVLSLYGTRVDQPAVPTTFVSAADGWRRLPEELQARVNGLHAAHTTGEVRRGDLTDVLITSVERPVTNAKPVKLPHPRTGVPLLYASEQMTKEIVELDAAASEVLLEELFAYLYDPAFQLEHAWRVHDLLVWDNIALQHGRPKVTTDGPARTLRKFAHPMPRMDVDEMPVYSDSM